jgi:uncharacterized protein YqfB (UPF0267 family)
MWQIPSAAAQSKRRKRATAKYHFKRTLVQLKLDGELNTERKVIVPGRLFFNEFNERRISLFSEIRFETGDSISITFQSPRRFFCKVKVLSCQEIPRETRVISPEKYDYRLVMEVLCEEDTELEEIRAFLLQIHKEYLETPEMRRLKEERRQQPQQSMVQANPNREMAMESAPDAGGDPLGDLGDDLMKDLMEMGDPSDSEAA